MCGTKIRDTIPNSNTHFQAGIAILLVKVSRCPPILSSVCYKIINRKKVHVKH